MASAAGTDSQRSLRLRMSGSTIIVHERNTNVLLMASTAEIKPFPKAVNMELAKVL